MTVREINKRLDAINAEASALQKALDEKMRNSILRCVWCGKGKRVSDLTLLQTHWYVQPYSCTGGDYWKRGEVQYKCPSCGELNRGLRETWHGCNARILDLQRYFGDEKDVYDK